MILDAETKVALAEELDDIALELAMPSQDHAETKTLSLFHSIYTEIERLRDTAELYEFEELTHIATWVLDNVTALKTNPTRLAKYYEQGQYYTWIELLATLLSEEEETAQAALFAELNTNLHQVTWLLVIDNALLQQLLIALSLPALAEQIITESSSTPPSAKTDDVGYRLAWDEDIHPELLDAFLTETPDLVTETAALIRTISTGDADSAIHQKAARLAHTIKGSSAVVGIEAIANFAHQLEDVLEHSLESVLPSAATDCLLEAADCLEAMFDSLQTQATPPAEYSTLLIQLGEWDKKIRAGEVSELPVEITQVIEKDSALTWDNCIHPDLLAAYLSEMPENVLQISQHLRAFSDGSSHDNNSHDKKAKKDPYQQTALLAHTLRGSSATVGVTALVDIAGKLEAIFDVVMAQPAVKPSVKEQGALLTETAVLLENLYESLLSKGKLPANYQSLLTQLMLWQQQLEVKQVASPEPQPVINKPDNDATSSTQSPSIPTEVRIKTALKSLKLPPMSTLQSVVVTPNIVAKKPAKQRVPLNEATLRVPVSLIEKLLNFSNELITSNTQLAEYTQALLNDKRVVHERNERIRSLVDELEWAVGRQSSRHSQHTDYSNPESTLFDPLEMDNYNALHGISNLLAETTNDERETSLALIKQFHLLKDHVVEQQKINKALNASVLAMRMEPVTQLTPRLERIVRETCRQTKKKANLSITGNELALDTDVLKGLLDPLLHLLRNAVDHGIESPEQRKQNNKSPTGEISLDFNQQGDQVLLSLTDDGAGMDADAIYQQAVKKGLIKQDSVLSEDQKLLLILQAGFSTRKKVSKISGRGVGMDIVNTAINDLSGSLRLTSEKGKGTTIQIQVPLTLVAINTLLVELAGHIIAIPSAFIQQIHYLEKGAIQRQQQQVLIRFEEQDIPLLSLSTLLDWPVSPFDEGKAQPIIIVNQGEQYYAFYFDQVMNFQEIVLKTLKPWMAKTHGVNGVCLLQNGVVAPVLNLNELLTDIPQAAFQIETIAANATTISEPHAVTSRRILVVDDSLSNRKALSLTIEPLGYAVTTAVDGVDAIQQLDKMPFGLVITDLEMPNMNGIQLTEYIRGQEEIRHYPVVMVTSRSTNKHRTLAAKAGVDEYLTKPVNTATLKSCIETFITGDDSDEMNIYNKQEK